MKATLSNFMNWITINQFCLLVPSKLLDPEYDCNLDSVPVDVSKEEFQLERQRLQNFIAGSEDKRILWTTDLLNFYNLSNSSTSVFLSKYCPNVTDFLTTGISVASCDRSFSKIKLIKNYLRSTMSDTRLTNLAILSIARDWQMKLILMM